MKKIEIYKKVLRDVSDKFIGTEKFINERIKFAYAENYLLKK